MEPTPTTEDVVCPFCGEGDFDLIGLKMHLNMGWCNEFNDIKVNAPNLTV